jgi:hypothetical protein
MTDLPALQWHRGQVPATQPAINQTQQDVTPSAGIRKAAGSLELQDVQEGMDTDEGIRTLSPLT